MFGLVDFALIVKALFAHRTAYRHPGGSAEKCLDDLLSAPKTGTQFVAPAQGRQGFHRITRVNQGMIGARDPRDRIERQPEAYG